MLLILSQDGRTVRIEEPANFTRLSILASSPVVVADAFRECRHSADGHVFLPVAMVRGLAGELATDSEWQRDFDAMIAFARSSGWVEEDSVRVHVDYTE